MSILDYIKALFGEGRIRVDGVTTCGLSFTARISYIGDPDIDYVKLATGFGVEAEMVAEPDSIKAALERARGVTAEGRPYLIDMHIERRGSMANSTWYPDYSIASLRTRMV